MGGPDSTDRAIFGESSVDKSRVARSDVLDDVLGLKGFVGNHRCVLRHGRFGLAVYNYFWHL
jgi:hypothetical protein